MSTPQSRLASFRSYSYYHVLAMCDSSQTADALALSTELNVWEHATQDTRAEDLRANTQDLGPYSPKKVPGAGKYCILINGSTDASFVINTAKWTTATGAQAVPGDRSTSIAIEGSLNISEPKGIVFLDQVVKCSVALGVDSSQVVYVLKTFFVGHGFDSDQRQEYVEHIADIPPMTFTVVDVTGAFTEAGGSYEMLFVGAGHGAARLPQYSKAVNAMSVKAGDSLEQTLTNLQNNINENYRKYYDCVVGQIKEVDSSGAPTLAGYLRPVRYVIVVGNDYKDANGIKYTVTNQSQQFKNTAGCNDPAQVSFPAHTSIESAISTVMMMSPQVQADMAVGDTTNRAKYEFKIHSALVSTQAPDAAAGVLDYTIYYRVERVLTPKSISYDSSFALLSSDESQLTEDQRAQRNQLIENNLITFDYLYTGKNIDILEFEMKVNMGLAYLQTATLANTFKSQIETAPNRQTQPSTADANGLLVKFGTIVQTPIFFGSQIRSSNLINSNNGGHTIQSAYTLSKHASLEVTDVSMKILGNISLLGSINRTSSPSYVVQSADPAVRGKVLLGTDGSREPQFAYWSHSPAYVKVRIKMPRENDDFALFTGQSSTGDPRTDPGSTDYARDFWFDGYYYVVGVEHVFDDGKFTQTLQMLGLPQRSAFDAAKATAPKEVNINDSVGSCYDNQIGITPSETGSGERTSSVSVPTTPPSGTTDPTTRADAATVNAPDSANRTLSNVRDWDTASREVKDAILDAARRYNVDEVTLAQIISHESRFNKAAFNPASEATGLGQFIKSTWDGLIRQGKIFGLAQIVPDVRTDARLNAYGTAALLIENSNLINSKEVGDLYLAHFIGPPARQIVALDKAGRGNELVSTTMSAKQFAAVVRANPTIVKPNTTVRELRTWAAQAMAKTLKNGINVAPQKAASPAAAANAPTGSTRPSADPTNNQRTAGQKLGVQQDPAVRDAKKDTAPCGPTATAAPQDRPTRGGQ